MNDHVCLYVYLPDESRFIAFPNTKVAQKSISEYYKRESDSLYIECIDDPSDENYNLYELLHKRLLWISPTEGEPISSGVTTLWLKEHDDIKAIRIAIKYELNLLKDATKRYNRTVKNITARIERLIDYRNQEEGWFYAE